MSQFDPVTFPHRELTERVIGVFYDVYNELGFGFLESVYHRAMVIALGEAGLDVASEVRLPVYTTAKWSAISRRTSSSSGRSFSN